MASAYQTLLLSMGPLAYYPLADVAGPTIVDISGNGYDGTVSGSAPTYGVSGRIAGDNAILFAGATKITLPVGIPNAPASQFTIVALYKNAANFNGGGIARYNGQGLVNSKPTASVQGPLWCTDNGDIGGIRHGISLPTSTIGAAGAWNFSAITITAPTVGHVTNSPTVSTSNGELTGRSMNPTLDGGARQATGLSTIGWMSLGGGFFNGAIQHVAFFNRFLSTSEIQGLQAAAGYITLTNARTSQEAAEVIVFVAPRVRTSQEAAELVTTTIANARASQAALEVVADTTPPAKARTSQEGVEALATEVPATVFTSQVALETLTIRVPDPNARVSQNAGEMAVTLGPARAITSQVALELLSTNPLYAYTSQEALEVPATAFDANVFTSQMGAEVITVNPKYPVQDESWFWDIPILGVP